MVRKVNSLNTASCFLPHVLLGKTTLLLNFCLFPPSHLHFGPFFFFLIAGKKYHLTDLYLKRNRNDYVKFACPNISSVCVCETIIHLFIRGGCLFLVCLVPSLVGLCLGSNPSGLL